MNDARKLSGPPEWEGPTCDYCGTGGDIRAVVDKSGKKTELSCSDCFTGFDDLQTVADHEQEQADLRADYLHDRARDRKGEE